MPVHDLHIDDQPTTTFRADLNDALLAVASNASGPDEPTTRVAGMLWFNTTNGILYLRDATNSDWISLAEIDTAANRHKLVANSMRPHGRGDIQVQDADGDEVLTLAPATIQEVIDGIDNNKLVTPFNLLPALPMGNPESVNIYRRNVQVDLPRKTRAVLVQMSGGGGGGAASTGYELERDGVMLPFAAEGEHGGTSQLIIDDPDTLVELEHWYVDGGSKGLASSEAPVLPPIANLQGDLLEVNSGGTSGGQGITFGATDTPAHNGNNGTFDQFFTNRNDLGNKRIIFWPGDGGAGGNLKTADGAREGEKERPHGQDGQKGYSIIWIWK